ncbi:SAVMC3_10250 family protein [Streptomyces mauvecolor]|uniref:SAVMC3_10250 family protein n=1 Tax=Streptomyces mauvecolor TaxID=58345 RepID=A0ABV9UGP8_9ACTN
MRELIYLSQRKLGQFQEVEKRRRWLARVNQVNAKAPMGMGEIQLSMTDQAALGRPELARVLNHINASRPRPLWYFEGQPEPGEWVRFDVPLNYCVGKQGPLDPRTRSADLMTESMLLFWEPHQLRDHSRPRLLLHGAPEHLIGALPAERDSARPLWQGSSTAIGMTEFLRSARGGNAPPTSGYLSLAMDRLHWYLDRCMPAEMASRMSGHAKITFRTTPDWSRSGATPGTSGVTPGTVIVASPLYVEYGAPPGRQ